MEIKKSLKIDINGVEYRSLDEVPEQFRELIQKHLAPGSTTPEAVKNPIPPEDPMPAVRVESSQGLLWLAIAAAMALGAVYFFHR